MTEMVMVLETIRTDRALTSVLLSRVTVSMDIMAVVISMVMVLPTPLMIAPIAENLGVTPSDAQIRMVTVGPTRRENPAGMEIAIRPTGCKRSIPMAMADTTITVQIAVARTRNQMNSH